MIIWTSVVSRRSLALFTLHSEPSANIDEQQFKRQIRLNATLIFWTNWLLSIESPHSAFWWLILSCQISKNSAYSLLIITSFQFLELSLWQDSCVCAEQWTFSSQLQWTIKLKFNSLMKYCQLLNANRAQLLKLIY